VGLGHLLLGNFSFILCLFSIIPYASIDLTAYETLKSTYANVTGNKKPSTVVHLVCGALAGTLSATVVYPLGLIRTRLQAQGTSTHREQYPRGAIDVIIRTYRKESIRGFYKGLLPTLIKVVPAVSISYITYEKAKQFLDLK
jgi:solute carrier family 25 (mitochondrial phosphate transporter), member 23/24/25/41